MNLSIKKSWINDIYHNDFDDYSTKFQIMYGGGGSGKSHYVVQKIIVKALRQKRNVLIIRKTRASIKDSIYKLFNRILEDMQVSPFIKLNKTDLEMTFPNGSTIIFKGLDNSEKLKSIDNISDIVIEEATEISLEDFNQLKIRLRSKLPNQQIYLMFNPISKTNWVYDAFFNPETRFEGEDYKIIHSTYLNNLKNLPYDYVRTLEEMKKNEKSRLYYNIYALGEFGSLDKLIIQDYKVTQFDFELLNFRELCGLDFGFTNDPTAFIRIKVDEKNRIIYVGNADYLTTKTNPEIASYLKKINCDSKYITADSSEPKSIEELRRNGIHYIKGAKKLSGSVVHGLQLMQQFTIYIKPEMKELKQEFDNYSWKKDKNGEYLNEPIDKFNHLIDAFRYALEELKDNRIRSLLRYK